MNTLRRTLILATLCLCSFISAQAQTALVQIIHNSADTSISTVDVWLNDERVAENLAFHYATAFLTLNATDSADWALRNSGDSLAIPALITWNMPLAAATKHIVVINGVTDSTLYHPYIPLRLDHRSEAMDLSASSASIDITFCHGITDIDSINIAETALFQLTAFEDVAIGEFTDYLNVFTADYALGITNASDSALLGDFNAPFSSLLWAGKAITVVSGGFFNQSLNNNGMPLGMWATTRAGGPMVCLQPNALDLSAQVQLIHNSPNGATASIDITVNGNPWLNDFSVHHATPFIPFPAGQDAVITIHSNITQGPIDSIWTDTLRLNSGVNYQLFFIGSGDIAAPFDLIAHPYLQEALSNIDSLSVQCFHGAECYDSIAISTDTLLQLPLISTLSYAAISAPQTVAALREEWILFSTNDSIITYDVPLQNSIWQGHALTCVTFGNVLSNTFSTWLTTEEGGEMYALQPLIIPLPPVFAQAQFIHASADNFLQAVDIYINDSLYIDDFAFQSATPYIQIPAETALDIAVTPANASDTTGALLHAFVQPEADANYRLILWGIASATGYNPAQPLQLAINANVPQAPSGNLCAMQFFHGSTDAGQVSINESTTPIVPFFNDVYSGDFSFQNFLTADQDYGLAIYNAGANFLYGNYALPLQSWGLAGTSFTIVSCGFRGPANNSGGAPFKLIAVFADGTSIELPIFVIVEEAAMESMKFFPNPSNDELMLNLHKTIAGKKTLRIIDINGAVKWQETINAGMHNENIHISTSTLTTGYYRLEAIADGYYASKPLIIHH
jgi:hypothetical protein